jgi:hypothetical protein
VNARRFYRLAPAHVLEQTVAWRQEAIERALADPDSAKRYRLSLTAEAFRTMPPERFVREFSDYAGAAERLAQAMQHAGKAYPNEADRQAFVNQARLRIAERIEEGGPFRRIKISDSRARWATASSSTVAYRGDTPPTGPRSPRDADTPPQARTARLRRRPPSRARTAVGVVARRQSLPRTRLAPAPSMTIACRCPSDETPR